MVPRVSGFNNNIDTMSVTLSRSYLIYRLYMQVGEEYNNAQLLNRDFMF